MAVVRHQSCLYAATPTSFGTAITVRNVKSNSSKLFFHYSVCSVMNWAGLYKLLDVNQIFNARYAGCTVRFEGSNVPE